MLKLICKGLFKSQYILTGILVFSIISVSNIAFAKKSKGAKNPDRALQIQVLHVPPGKPGNPQVVNVGSESALNAHLGHGDVVFGTDLDADGTGELTFRIDNTIEPIAPYVKGYPGGLPRPLGVIEGDDGRRSEYITNEVMIQTDNIDQLESFLARYGGTIIRDDTVLIGTEGGGTLEIPGGAEGLHIISFDPSKSMLIDLPENVMAAGYTGTFSFSSMDAMRTLALQLREQTIKADLNTLGFPQSLNEHPSDEVDANGSPVPIDFAEKWWMDDDTGLSTGVARAIRYLRHTGLPPEQGVWMPALVAIIDGGFDLDPETGLGSADYNNDPFNPPLQLDIVEWNESAGGAIAEEGHLMEWHGQQVFGVCCAYPRNGYGSAGTGGGLVKPLLINVATTHSQGGPCFTAADVFYAIYSAWHEGADVINMSLIVNPNFFDSGGNWQQRIYTAISDGGVVVAAASNEGHDISNRDVLPCKLNGVICVGGVNRDGNNVFNWGNGVDIWAPGDGLKTTVTPASSKLDSNNVGEDELSWFGGTSAAAPFVSGIVGMLKAVDLNDDNINLWWDDIQEILQSTANCSQTIDSPCPQTPDPKVVNGYVDALRAVQVVRDNPPPTAEISLPHDGGVKRWNEPIIFRAHVRDDPAPWGFVGSILFSSDREGEICTAEGKAVSNGLFCTKRLNALGTHIIRLDATDEWGAPSEPDYVSIEIANDPPRVTLTSPADGLVRSADQHVSFNAHVFDADGEDYKIPCPNIDGACVEWTDNGQDITPGSSFAILNFTRLLSAGEHEITLRATDGKGAMTSVSSTVTILEEASGEPTAHIYKVEIDPSRTNLVMTGRGFDPEDGELDASNLEWSSDLNGFLGTGNYLTVPLSPLIHDSDGTTEHIITLKATDSDGNEDTESRVFIIIIID